MSASAPLARGATTPTWKAYLPLRIVETPVSCATSSSSIKMDLGVLRNFGESLGEGPRGLGARFGPRQLRAKQELPHVAVVDPLEAEILDRHGCLTEFLRMTQLDGCWHCSNRKTF